MVELPYGKFSYPLDLPGHDLTIVRAPTPPPALTGAALDRVLDEALDAPIGRPRLDSFVAPDARVTIIVSDATRHEPRVRLVAALRRRLPNARITLAIATGTHGPADLDALDLPRDGIAEIINHDGHSDRDLVTLGTTRHGTPVILHRCVVDTDLVIATGCIRPHYFAGFGAGTKAIFPGLGQAAAIRINHRLKIATGSRAGIVDDNPCRADLEEAVRLLPVPTYLLDTHIAGAVAGDPITAFRAGVAAVRPYYTVKAPRASVVIASDALPVTATVYQAAKIAAAAAPLVAPNGRLVVVAECADGTGPLEVVNEAILRIGVLPRLPVGASLHLVSSLAREVVEQTLFRPCINPGELAVRSSSGPIVVLPNASQLICEPTS